MGPVDKRNRKISAVPQRQIDCPISARTWCSARVYGVLFIKMFFEMSLWIRKWYRKNFTEEKNTSKKGRTLRILRIIFQNFVSGWTTIARCKTIVSTLLLLVFKVRIYILIIRKCTYYQFFSFSIISFPKQVS